jgi:hypothetical protein
MDKQGYVVATTEIVTGNHNDAFELKRNLQQACKDMKQLGLAIKGAYFNADSTFDTRRNVSIGLRQLVTEFTEVPKPFRRRAWAD